MPTGTEPLVINTGPLIALGKADALDVVRRLPLLFLMPREVAAEIEAGRCMGYPVSVPAWVEVVAADSPAAASRSGFLDAGEAAVIQLAVERGIPAAGGGRASDPPGGPGGRCGDAEAA